MTKTTNPLVEEAVQETLDALMQLMQDLDDRIQARPSDDVERDGAMSMTAQMAAARRFADTFLVNTPDELQPTAEEAEALMSSLLSERYPQEIREILGLDSSAN